MSAPTAIDDWRIVTMVGGHTHSLMAIAPGCPDTRHATRWCECKVFRTRPDALAYISDRQSTQTCEDCGEAMSVRGLLSRCRPRHGAAS